MSDEIQVLTETFFISNESCAFTFDGCTLQWRATAVNVTDFIVVDYVHSGNCCAREKGKLLPFRKPAHKCEGHDTLVVHYVVAQKKNKLRLCSVKFQGESNKLSCWLRTLKDALDRVSEDRPTSYLVFINPFSGRQNGVDLFNKKVKPIFDLAKIETCVVTTKNRGDFEKVICSGVECYDAILAVGGDGTVSEIVNCLISSQMDFSVPDMDEEVEVPGIATPIAIIPCGSTDCVAYTLNGTRDPETSALYAVLGYRSCFDVCQAISECGLNRFFVSVFTYGYLSDLIGESEKFRWMGPMRYNYAGLLTLLRSKEYYGQLELTGEKCTNHPDPPPKKDKSRTLSMCNIPVVPTVEPGSEYVQQRVACLPKKSKCGSDTQVCKDVVLKDEPVCEVPEDKKEPDCGDAPPECQADAPADGEPSACEAKAEVPEDSCCGVATEPTPCAGEAEGQANPEPDTQEGCSGEKPPECEPCQEANTCTDVVRKDAERESIVSASCGGGRPGEPRRFCLKGRFFLIACANISCSSELTPNGIAPQCVPGDGNMNVVLFQPNSIRDLYKIYSRLTSKDRDFLLSDLPFVNIYKTKRVRICVVQKDVEKKNSANCDGELFHDSVVDIRLHEDLVQFIRRPPDPCE